jgi:GTP-binding protein HflX
VECSITPIFFSSTQFSPALHDLTPPRERALAIGVGTKRTDREEALEHLDELAFLAETAGADVLQKIYQSLDRIDGGTAVGKGKLAEIKEIVEQDSIQLVIFDDDLTPAQMRNLERELSVKIMDRSGIILDIFASRARTTESKLQVELAQLQYLLPRLTRMWTHLSKQFGGVGTKGPGETQIETDRRLIRDKIALLKEKLATVSVQKAEQRKGRESLQRFALVGYTNAGKSTLMNALSGANVFAENKLFATLDTTVRSIELSNSDGTSHKNVLLSDTVGFIRKLPPQLVASFRSTLAETVEADVLLHVVDVSHSQFGEQMTAVHETLEVIGAAEKPTILVFNKIDALESRDVLYSLQEEFPRSVGISAARGINLSTLKELMLETADERHEIVHLLLPYRAMKDLAQLYRTSAILSRNDGDDGIEISARIEKKHLHTVSAWMLTEAV